MGSKSHRDTRLDEGVRIWVGFARKCTVSHENNSVSFTPICHFPGWIVVILKYVSLDDLFSLLTVWIFERRSPSPSSLTDQMGEDFTCQNMARTKSRGITF
ncbi:uncharacterized protein LOC120122193 [Hibiscus syriacus]|uniref:uncharacterized protein LOC120122193 n=1 Tax=Hibiscus syriacus TaxID=106335 RepID=UPI001920B79F|nr:uncharacterized protein LOC120122193 [Hibiscus syriacus]